MISTHAWSTCNLCMHQLESRCQVDSISNHTSVGAVARDPGLRSVMAPSERWEGINEVGYTTVAGADAIHAGASDSLLRVVGLRSARKSLEGIELFQSDHRGVVCGVSGSILACFRPPERTRPSSLKVPVYFDPSVQWVTISPCTP